MYKVVEVKTAMRALMGTAALVMVGCSKAPEPSAEPTTLSGDVVATVNAMPITQEELALVAEQTFGPQAGLLAFSNGGAEQKLLESVIGRKLMAAKQLTQMSEYDKQALALKLAIYEELADYYQQHSSTLGPRQMHSGTTHFAFTLFQRALAGI